MRSGCTCRRWLLLLRSPHLAKVYVHRHSHLELLFLCAQRRRLHEEAEAQVLTLRVIVNSLFQVELQSDDHAVLHFLVEELLLVLADQEGLRQVLLLLGGVREVIQYVTRLYLALIFWQLAHRINFLGHCILLSQQRHRQLGKCDLGHRVINVEELELYLQRASLFILRVSVNSDLRHDVSEQEGYRLALIAHEWVLALLHEDLRAGLAFLETLSQEVVGRGHQVFHLIDLVSHVL